MKLDNQHVSPFLIKHIFEKNPLIVKLKLPAFMKIHSVFHVSLLSHIATDPLPGQQQEPQEPIVAENGNQFWISSLIDNTVLHFSNTTLIGKVISLFENLSISFTTVKMLLISFMSQTSLLLNPMSILVQFLTVNVMTSAQILLKILSRFSKH